MTECHTRSRGVTPSYPDQPIQTKKELSRGASTVEAEFERFWTHAHRKIGKAETLAEFEKLKPDSALVDRMIAAIDDQKTWPGLKPGESHPLPDPVRWIKRRKWEDEPPRQAIAPKPAYLRPFAEGR